MERLAAPVARRALGARWKDHNARALALKSVWGAETCFFFFWLFYCKSWVLFGGVSISVTLVTLYLGILSGNLNFQRYNISECKRFKCSEEKSEEIM